MLPISSNIFQPVRPSQPVYGERADSQHVKRQGGGIAKPAPPVQDDQVVARRAGLLETIAEAQREFLASTGGGSLTIVRAAALVHGAFAGFISYCLSGAHYDNATERAQLTENADRLLGELGLASDQGLVRLQKRIDELEGRFASRGLSELWGKVSDAMHREIFKRFRVSLGLIGDGDNYAH